MIKYKPSPSAAPVISVTIHDRKIDAVNRSVIDVNNVNGSTGTFDRVKSKKQFSVLVAITFRWLFICKIGRRCWFITIKILIIS